MDFNSIPGVSSAKQYISAAKEYLYNNETAVDAGLKVKAFAADAGQKVKAAATDAFVALQGGVENVKKYGATYKNELIQVAALTMLATAVAAATKCYLDAPVPVIGDASPVAEPTNFENVSVKGSLMVEQGSVINNAYCKNDINPFNIVNDGANTVSNQASSIAENFFSTLVQEKEEQKADLPNVEKNKEEELSSEHKSELELEDDLPETEEKEEEQHSTAEKNENAAAAPGPGIPEDLVGNFSAKQINPFQTTPYKLPTTLNQPIVTNGGKLLDNVSKIMVQDTKKKLSLEDQLTAYFASKNISIPVPVVKQSQSYPDVKAIVGDVFMWGSAKKDELSVAAQERWTAVVGSSQLAKVQDVTSKIQQNDLNRMNFMADTVSSTINLAYQIPVRDMAVGIKDRVVNYGSGALNLVSQIRDGVVIGGRVINGAYQIIHEAVNVCTPAIIRPLFVSIKYDNIETIKVRGTERVLLFPKKKNHL